MNVCSQVNVQKPIDCMTTWLKYTQCLKSVRTQIGQKEQGRISGARALVHQAVPANSTLQRQLC